jgi:hypothetical protein
MRQLCIYILLPKKIINFPSEFRKKNTIIAINTRIAVCAYTDRFAKRWKTIHATFLVAGQARTLKQSNKRNRIWGVRGAYPGPAGKNAGDDEGDCAVGTAARQRDPGLRRLSYRGRRSGSIQNVIRPFETNVQEEVRLFVQCGGLD